MIPAESKQFPGELLTQSLLARPMGTASWLSVFLMLVAGWAPLPWQISSPELLAMRLALMSWVIGLGAVLTWNLLRQRLRAREWVVAGCIGLMLGTWQTLLAPDTVPGWPSAVYNALPALAYALLPLLLFASLHVVAPRPRRAALALVLAIPGALLVAISFGTLLAGTASGADVADGSVVRPFLIGAVLLFAAGLACRARQEA